MSKADYTEFDKALLIAILTGYNTMASLDSEKSGLQKLAELHQMQGLFGARVSSSRVIDRRLQALRKKGQVRFNGRYWVRLVEGRPAR